MGTVWGWVVLVTEQNQCKGLTFPGCLLLQETSVEQAFLVVQATDNCAVTQLHNHSTLHKGVHFREPRVSFSDVCGKGGFPQAFN